MKDEPTIELLQRARFKPHTTHHEWCGCAINSGIDYAIAQLRRVKLLEALYAACIAADHYDTGLKVGEDYDAAMEALAADDAAKEPPRGP